MTSLAACAGPVDQIRTDLAGQVVRHHASRHEPELGVFYAEHGRLLWVADGAIRPEARTLIAIAGPDAGPVALAVDQARSRTPSALAHAELALSAALMKVALAAGTTSARIVFADPALAQPRDGLEALRRAAQAPSLEGHINDLTRGNLLYAELADASRRGALSLEARARVQANLDRLKALPINLGDRFVLVDIPAARLWLYEGGRPVQSMRVIVGGRQDQTPLMAASLRYAVLHPYWNVPPDLVSERIAPQVLRLGPRALDAMEMEVLSDWTPGASITRPELVDWQAVAAGGAVRVRQRPGPRNTLGEAKFVMPNSLGIYLHDTPERRPLARRTAYRSAGCIRLADSDRLGRWLFGSEWRTSSRSESRLTLAKPVAVYIVYRTARVENGAIHFEPDPYGLDRPVHLAPHPAVPRSPANRAGQIVG